MAMQTARLGSLGTWYGDTYVPMLIGKLEDINYYFNGSIDEVKVYKRALAAGQVRMIYENQTNKIHSSMTSAGGELVSLRDS